MNKRNKNKTLNNSGKLFLVMLHTSRKKNLGEKMTFPFTVVVRFSTAKVDRVGF